MPSQSQRQLAAIVFADIVGLFLQYGTELMKPVWYDEHVIDSRKKLGLPVMSRET